MPETFIGASRADRTDRLAFPGRGWTPQLRVAPRAPGSWRKTEANDLPRRGLTPQPRVAQRTLGRPRPDNGFYPEGVVQGRRVVQPLRGRGAWGAAIPRVRCATLGCGV